MTAEEAAWTQGTEEEKKAQFGPTPLVDVNDPELALRMQAQRDSAAYQNALAQGLVAAGQGLGNLAGIQPTPPPSYTPATQIAPQITPGRIILTPPPSVLGVKGSSPVGTIGQLGNIASQFGQAAKEAPGKIEEIYQPSEEAIRKSKEVAQQHAERIGELTGIASSQLLRTQIYQETENFMTQKALTEARLQKEDMELASKYAYYDGPVENLKHLANIAENGSPEQQKAARAKLVRYEEPDQTRLLGSTKNKIIAALAVGLGAFSSALTGGPNIPAQMISNMIEKDLQAQQARAAGKKNALFRLLDGIKDDSQRLLMGRIKMYELAQLIVENEKVKMGVSEKVAFYDQTLGALQVEKEKYENELISHNRANQASILGNKISAQIQLSQSEQKGPARVPAELAASLGGMISTIDQAVQMRDDFARLGPEAFFTKWWGGSKAGEYEANREQFLVEFRHALTGAGFSDKERESYANMFPTAADFKAGGIAKWNAAIAKLKSQAKAKLAALQSSGYDVNSMKYQLLQHIASDEFGISSRNISSRNQPQNSYGFKANE